MSQKSSSMKVCNTSRFAVLDLTSNNANNKVTPKHADAKKRDQTRSNKESGDRMENTGRIGGTFNVSQNAEFLQNRISVFERLWAEKEAEIATLPDLTINITLPSGDIKQGIANKTTPLDIAKQISQGLADSVVISKVLLLNNTNDDGLVACDEDEDAVKAAPDHTANADAGELWDLNRPIPGDCNMTLLKFEDPEAKTVFWHSSAHVLGAAIEAVYG
eukprot:gene45351-60583_t